MEPSNMAPKERNVFLFVPNLIGYARIVLMIIAFYYMTNPEQYTVTVACYMLSQLLDAFDGHAARILNQCTKLGAMLDMLTDRVSTLGLVMGLGILYPEHFFWFQLYAVLDIGAHWLHMTSTHHGGATSHKQIDLSQNPVLYYYYQRPILFTMCAGNELFFSALYLLNFTEGPMFSGMGLWRSMTYICAPVMALKTFISFVHLIAAANNIAVVDAHEHSQAKR